MNVDSSGFRPIAVVNVHDVEEANGFRYYETKKTGQNVGMFG